MRDFIIHYWMEFLLSLLSGVIVGIVAQFKAIKKGMKELLKDRIIQSYNHYMEKGYMPIYALESVNGMYEQYHALGGNGTITILVNELIELPTAKPRNQKRKVVE